MGGVSHDAAYWDERYAEASGAHREHDFSGGPDPAVVAAVTPLPPGRAIDVAAGRGRHALWLAGLGWDVTAIDFSGVGIDEGRGHEAHIGPFDSPIDWVVADATVWEPGPDASYDLILCAFFHLEDSVFARVRRWLAPGGHLLVVGHALRNLTDGVGGPTDPTYLHTEARLRAVATGLTIERLEEVVRPTPAGDQIDIVLLARRT
jgi:SAM-dependent methyltransferase